MKYVVRLVVKRPVTIEQKEWVKQLEAKMNEQIKKIENMGIAIGSMSESNIVDLVKQEAGIEISLERV